MMALTLVEKIIRAHLVDGALERGSRIGIRIDQTLCQDATGTMAFLELEAMGIDRVKTEISVQYVDHNTTQNGPENHNDHLYLQTVCAAKGAYYSRPGNGICHQVHLERFGVPGKTLLGSDSHTPTNGGIGMLAIGAGGLDVAVAMAGGPFTLAMPKLIGVRLSGRLTPFVAAKDVILTLLSILTTKGNVGMAVEYFGAGVATLSVPERATIANMGAELGVTASVFPSDEVTRAFLKAQGREACWQSLAADAGAVYDRVIEIDLDAVVPLAACPSSPDHIRPVSELAGMAVQQVAIGSCTNSSLKDLTTVARMLEGRRVDAGVSLGVAPGSRQVMEMLARNGSLTELISSGIRLLESACGPCIGQGFSPASGTVTLRTFNRNFPGRTGTPGDQAYLVSPETAAAAALTGKITDPRTLGIPPIHWREPEQFLVDDTMIIVPPPPGTAVEIIRKETIGEPPRCTAFPASLDGEVLIKVGDKTTTDHIMPAGRHLKLRSNIPAYAKVVFECFNQAGRPTFAERAAGVRDSGRAGIIVARDSYGQGSSREHAAICPMFLGVRVVLAVGIERIHAANLVNFGILPLYFQNAADYERMAEGDQVRIAGVAALLQGGTAVPLAVVRPDGTSFVLQASHRLSRRDVDTVLAGGLLAMAKR
jgi:aconitate hydratase